MDGTITTRKPSALLADPAQVAAIRALIAHARKHNAEHAVYSHGDGLGHSMGYREHTWTLDGRRVSYHDGELRYLIDGVPVLKVHTVDIRQATDLLVDLKVLPQRFSSLAETMRRLADELECEGSTDQLDSAFRIRQTLDGEYEPTGDPR